MKIEVIIETLEHDGERVPVGTILDVPAASAQALIDVGAAQKATKKAAKADA